MFYEELLETVSPPRVQIAAFTDDVAVIGNARTGPLAVELINPVLNTMS